MPNIKYRRDKSSVSKINIHLVFVTKYRKKLFENKHLDCIKEVMNGVAKRMDFEILEIEGESDHVHLSLIFSGFLPVLYNL
jgi:putative transposase